MPPPNVGVSPNVALPTVTVLLASEPFTASFPFVTVVGPVYVFAAFNTNVPDPICVNEPLPLIAAVEKSTPCVGVSERSNTNDPLSTMALVDANAPVVPPLSSCKVAPPLIVVAPV
jgi:hypothetical protein